MINPNLNPAQSELGKQSDYNLPYSAEILFPIDRQPQRDEIGVTSPLPFYGLDVWNHYEVSWLNSKGKPVVAFAEISYACTTPHLIESKSMKLYFNSFNNVSFSSAEALQAIVARDLSQAAGGTVTVQFHLLPLSQEGMVLSHFEGICLDELDVACEHYTVQTESLVTEGNAVEETLYSNLLKSNCLVTNQPDWGSVQIHYSGNKINHAGLLQYIVSFRNHNEFHEQCIERIFMDITRLCKPERLIVYGRYTRRGGLDINPYRSSEPVLQVMNGRLVRQ